MALAVEKQPEQLDFLDMGMALAACKSPSEAFHLAFSQDFLSQAYEERISLKRMRGVDGVTQKVFEKKKEEEIKLISNKVKNANYRFSPYLEILKPKGRDKLPRVLSTPTIRDKLTLFCLKEFLQYLYNEEIAKSHPNEHISRLCNVLDKNKTIKHFYRGDIKSFYPAISRKKLLLKLKNKFDYNPFITLVESALQSPTKPITSKGPKQTGVPQGLSISNILADIYLLDFDKGMEKSGTFYGRFVDDIVFTGSLPSLMQSYLFMRFWFWKNSLKLNREKSKKGRFDAGIDYLGYHIKNKVDGDDKIYVGVRDSSQQRLLDSLCGLITSYKHTENPKHIHRLNRRITGVIWQNKRYGWLFYFSELNDLSILRRFDSIIAKLKVRSNVRGFETKKFVNTLWRIKKSKWGKYITNFDEYSPEQMKDYLEVSMEKTREDLDKLSYVVMRRLFIQEVQKEIDKMEQDIGDMY